MRAKEPFKTKWFMLKNLNGTVGTPATAACIYLPATATKEKAERRIPITYELRQLLIAMK